MCIGNTCQLLNSTGICCLITCSASGQVEQREYRHIEIARKGSRWMHMILMSPRNASIDLPPNNVWMILLNNENEEGSTKSGHFFLRRFKRVFDPGTVNLVIALI